MSHLKRLETLQIMGKVLWVTHRLLTSSQLLKVDRQNFLKIQLKWRGSLYIDTIYEVIQDNVRRRIWLSHLMDLSVSPQYWKHNDTLDIRSIHAVTEVSVSLLDLRSSADPSTLLQT